MNTKSRVMGDYHARFCEGLGVKFPRSTRQRFWRSLKREYVYLNPVENGTELYHGIKTYIDYYNTERTHKGINRQRPVDWYDFAA